MKIIKDYLVNLYLEIRLWLYFKGIVKIRDTRVFSGQLLYPQKQDALRTFKSGLPWGIVHPDYDFQISTEEAVVDRGFPFGNKQLELLHLIYDEPYTFPNGDRKGDVVRPFIDAGVVHVRTPFLYGLFEISCRLPESNDAWSSFWFFGADSWPPEIDVFEFLPGTIKSGTYRMSTNFHYKTAENRKSKPSAYRLLNSSSKRIMRFGIDWQYDYIAIYYDGKLIRKITQERILKYMRKPMYLVLGTGAMSRDVARDFFYSKFTIYSLTYNIG